jgi:hypothetical protein
MLRLDDVAFEARDEIHYVTPFALRHVELFHCCRKMSSEGEVVFFECAPRGLLFLRQDAGLRLTGCASFRLVKPEFPREE